MQSRLNLFGGNVLSAAPFRYQHLCGKTKSQNMNVRYPTIQFFKRSFFESFIFSLAPSGLATITQRFKLWMKSSTSTLLAKWALTGPAKYAWWFTVEAGAWAIRWRQVFFQDSRFGFELLLDRNVSSVVDRIKKNDRKTLSQLGQIVRKNRLVNTATSSFHTIMCKRPKCLSEKKAGSIRLCMKMLVVVLHDLKSCSWKTHVLSNPLVFQNLPCDDNCVGFLLLERCRWWNVKWECTKDAFLAKAKRLSWQPL